MEQPISNAVSALAVDLSSVPHAHYLDDQLLVDDLVDDPVVTDAHPVGAILTGQRHASRRARVVSKEFDRGVNS